MLWEYEMDALPQTARRKGCGTLRRLRHQSWEGPVVTREGKTSEPRPQEAKGGRSHRTGAWACSSDEAGVMLAEQRSPGCSSDGRIRSRSLNRGVLLSQKSDRAGANRELGKAIPWKATVGICIWNRIEEISPSGILEGEMESSAISGRSRAGA